MPAAASGGWGMGEDVVAAHERRARVHSALEVARVPVEECAAGGGGPGAPPALMVMGCVRLPYPYTPEACECANEIVLSRVQQLVASVQ